MSLLWHWPGCTIRGGDVRIVVGAPRAGEGCSVGCSSGAGPARILSSNRVYIPAALTADISSRCSSYDAFSAGVWLGSKWSYRDLAWSIFVGVGVNRRVEIFDWFFVGVNSRVEVFSWSIFGVGVNIVTLVLVVLSSFFTSILAERRCVLAVQDIN